MMRHLPMRNSFIGSPVERLEDLRFLRGRGQYVDDVPSKDALHAAILRSPVAHGRVRSIDTGAAKKRPGVHAVITAPISATDSGHHVAAGIAAGVHALPAAGDCQRQSALRRRAARRGRGRHAPRSPKMRSKRSRSRSRRCRRSPTATTRAATRAAVRDRRHQPRRSRCPRSAATPRRRSRTRPTPGASASRCSASRRCTMEPRGLLAEWDVATAAPDRVRHDQGGVPQPPHAGQTDGPRRRRDHHDRGRRRRRFRRARRVLSRGFPDPVRGAQARARR